MDSFYHFKHWLLTILIAPIFLIFSFLISDKNLVPNFIQIYFISTVIGFVLSSPAFLFYCVIFYIALDRISSPLVMKTVLNLTAIVGIFATIYFAFDSIDLIVSIPYAASVIFSSWIIRIKKEKV